MNLSAAEGYGYTWALIGEIILAIPIDDKTLELVYDTETYEIKEAHRVIDANNNVTEDVSLEHPQVSLAPTKVPVDMVAELNEPSGEDSVTVGIDPNTNQTFSYQSNVDAFSDGENKVWQVVDGNIMSTTVKGKFLFLYKYKGKNVSSVSAYDPKTNKYLMTIVPLERTLNGSSMAMRMPVGEESATTHIEIAHIKKGKVISIAITLSSKPQDAIKEYDVPLSEEEKSQYEDITWLDHEVATKACRLVSNMGAETVPNRIMKKLK